MKAQFVWIAIAAIAAGASAQTSAGAGEYGSAAAQAGQASASTAQATAVNAELTKKIDSKDAKVGDQVLAKTTTEAKFADGTKIPKGSKLVGHVTAVEARSKENRDGHVAFCFDHALLRDGRELPLNAMVRAIAAPAAMAPAPNDQDMMMAGGAGVPGANAGIAGGGLAGNGPGGAIHGATNVAGDAAANTAGGLHTPTSGIDGTVNGAAAEGGALGTGRAAANGAALNNAAGLGAAGGAALPVANLSGVTFAAVNLAADAGTGGASAAGGAAIGTMLTGHNKNVTLDSGSQMAIAVAPR